MVDYKVVRSTRRRFSSSISVTADRGVVVSVPKWVSLGVIEDMVREKADWIAKALARLGGVHQQSKKRFVDGEKHLYFGEEYPLVVVPSPGIATARLTFLDNRFEAKVPSHHTSIQQRKDLKEALLRWYLDN